MVTLINPAACDCGAVGDPELWHPKECAAFTLPDSPYSVPGREGTPEQIRMAMREVAMGLRRVEEDEAAGAGSVGRMGKP